MPDTDTDTNTDDLALAMKYVLAAGPEQVAWGAADPRAPKPVPSWTAKHRHPMGLHRHADPELCVAMNGSAVLEIDSSRLVMTAPMFAVLQPGTVHCESFRQARRGYEMLWVLPTRRGTWASIVSYEPSSKPVSARWTVTRRYWVRSAAAQQLRQTLIDPRLPTRPDRDRRLRAHLLLVLGEMHSDHVNATDAHAPILPGRTSGEHLAARVRDIIERDPGRTPSVREMARQMRVTPTYLHRVFRRTYGEKIAFYTRRAQMEAADKLLRTTKLLVKEVAARVGYDDQLYFSRQFHRHHGMSPAAVRRYGRA